MDGWNSFRRARSNWCDACALKPTALATSSAMSGSACPVVPDNTCVRAETLCIRTFCTLCNALSSLFISTGACLNTSGLHTITPNLSQFRGILTVRTRVWMVSASIPWVRTWLTDSATVSLITILLPTCVPVSDFRVDMLADSNDVGSACDSSTVPEVPTLLSFVGVWATRNLTEV